jgi:hypothetical protein
MFVKGDPDVPFMEVAQAYRHRARRAGQGRITAKIETGTIRTMNRGRIAAVVALAASGAAGRGCNKLKARPAQQGVQQYKSGPLRAGHRPLQNAVELDPRLLNARLYLATAYANQYVPGVDSPDNNRNAELAIEQFQECAEARAGKPQQPEGHRRPLLPDEEIRAGQGFPAAGHPERSQRPGSVLLHRGHRLTQTYVPRMEERAAGAEAG